MQMILPGAGVQAWEPAERRCRTGVRRAAGTLAVAVAVGLAAGSARPADAPGPNWEVNPDLPAAEDSRGAPEDEPEPVQPEPGWEGALGLIVRHGSAYPGSARMETKLNPGGFLRWGRYTVTGAGGFTTRRNVDVERGIGAELLRRDGLRVRLSLRYDGGRSDGSSPELVGLGEIRSTVRSRLAVRWEPTPGWVYTGAAGWDLLDRVGGYTLDASVSREWTFGHGRRLGMAVGVNGASDRYMQVWHGITPEQSGRSGYPVYRAGAGLHEAYASVSYRHEFGHDWSSFVAAQANRLLGPAAGSPLTRRAGTQGVSAGLARRF